MQIRCYNCHKPYAIGKDAMRAALDMIYEEDLNHYNAQCPHCRRANRISKEALERAVPDWEPPEGEAEEE